MTCSFILEKAFSLALKVAKSAGDFLIKATRKTKRVSYKSCHWDLVTDKDKESEQIIVSAIKKRFPDHAIITEESPALKTDSDFKWYIDPLDGTVNFVHGLSFFSISLALSYRNELLLGVIYNPCMKEIFYARKNKGAFRNGKRIRVSTTSTIADSFLATGFPYQYDARLKNLKLFNEFVKRTRAVRRLGSAALDIAYTACGIFDGFWEFALHEWDIAAGIVIAKEAGAKVTDFQGKEVSPEKGEIVVSNGRIHNQMLKVISSTLKQIR